MKLPTVKGSNGAYTRRLHPLSCSIRLSLQPLSTVNMVLPPTDEISVLDWVKVPAPDGTAGFYRVSSVSTDAQTGEKSVYMEHGACTLGDMILPESAIPSEYKNQAKTVTEVLSFLLTQQSVWSVGGISAGSGDGMKPSSKVYIDLAEHTVMDNITTLLQSIPDFYAEFDQQDETTWRINIKERAADPQCEVRLRRNLKSCDLSLDASAICTRLYVDGINQAGYIDSDNANPQHVPYYGVRSETKFMDDRLTAAQKNLIAKSYLSLHDHPRVSISISGVELSQVTGLAIDKFTVGSICRVAIPWLGITEAEMVTEKVYKDPYSAPESVTLTLANATPDLSITLAAITGGGGGGMAGQITETKKDKKRFETKFDQTDHYFSLIATDTDWSNLDSGDVKIYSQLVQTASSLQSVVSRTGYTADAFFDSSHNYVVGDVVMYEGKMYEFTAAHHGQWDSTHVRQITSMYSSITQHENSIESLVSKTGVDELGGSETLYSKISQQAGLIDLVVDSSGQQAGIKIGAIASALNNDPGVSIYGSKIDISTLSSTQRQQWENTLGFVTSAEVVITDEQISQVVQRVEETVVDDATQEVTQTVLSSASLILAINGDGSSSAAISADKIQLSGSTTIDGLLGTESVTGGTALKVKGGAVSAPLGYYTGSAGEYHLNASGNLTCETIDVGYGSPISMSDSSFHAFGLNVTGGSEGAMKYGGKVVLTEDNDYIASIEKITSGLADGQFGFKWTKLSGTPGQITFNVADTAWYSGRVSAFKSAVSTALGSAGWNGATGKATQIYGSLSTAQGKLLINQATMQVTYPGDESPTTVNIGIGSLDVSSTLSSYAADIRSDAMQAVTKGNWQLSNGAAQVPVTANGDTLFTVDMLPAADWDVNIGTFSTTGATVTFRPYISGVYGDPVKTATVPNPVGSVGAPTFAPSNNASFRNSVTMHAYRSGGTYSLKGQKITMARSYDSTNHSWHHVNLHIGEDSSGPLIARINVHDTIYKDGWNECYKTVTISPSSEQTLTPGHSVTVYAKAKNYSGSEQNVASVKVSVNKATLNGPTWNAVTGQLPDHRTFTVSVVGDSTAKVSETLSLSQGEWSSGKKTVSMNTSGGTSIASIVVEDSGSSPSIGLSDARGPLSYDPGLTYTQCFTNYVVYGAGWYVFTITAGDTVKKYKFYAPTNE